MGNIFNNQEQQFPHDSCIMGITNEGQKVFFSTWGVHSKEPIWITDPNEAYHAEHNQVMKVWFDIATKNKNMQRIVVPTWESAVENYSNQTKATIKGNN